MYSSHLSWSHLLINPARGSQRPLPIRRSPLVAKLDLKDIAAVLGLALVLLAMPALALADEFKIPSFKQLLQAYKEIKDDPSKDTTPIEFTVGNVRYKVPRNYIIKMYRHKSGGQSLVEFKVTFPGFQPLTDETETCMTRTAAYAYDSVDCIPIRFLVSSGSKRLTEEERFNNALKTLRNPQPAPGPGEFEKFEGPHKINQNPSNGKNKIVLYKKMTEKHLLWFSCYFTKWDDGKETGVCTNFFSPLPGGDNSMEFAINFAHLKDAETIDTGLYNLLESFTVKGGSP